MNKTVPQDHQDTHAMTQTVEEWESIDHVYQEYELCGQE